MSATSRPLPTERRSLATAAPPGPPFGETRFFDPRAAVPPRAHAAREGRARFAASGLVGASHVARRSPPARRLSARRGLPRLRHPAVVLPAGRRDGARGRVAHVVGDAAPRL